MAVKVYKVKTNTQNQQNRLDVIDNGKPIDVNENTTIVWYLDFDGGTFNAVDGSSTSGFLWPTDNKPAGFGTATLAPGDQVLTIVDDASDKGNFIYQLNATVKVNGVDTNFSTTFSSPGATMNNPTIKNT